MSEAMADERLAEIEAARHRLYRAVYTSGYPGAGQAFETVAAEIDRLRAALAARPEPIGYYILARQTERGSWSSTGVMSRIEAEAARERWDYLADDTLYAVVPVDGTP